MQQFWAAENYRLPPLEKPPKIRNPPENKEGEREIILTRAITGAFYSL